jgi:hypothetical protein
VVGKIRKIRMNEIKQKGKEIMIYKSESLERISFQFCTVIRQHTFNEWSIKIFTDAQGEY